VKKSVSIYFGRAAYVALFLVAMLGLYSYLESHKVPAVVPMISDDAKSAQIGSGY
jgi:hypothetical protein